MAGLALVLRHATCPIRIYWSQQQQDDLRSSGIGIDEPTAF